MTRLRQLAFVLPLFVLSATPGSAMTPEQEKILERDCSGDYLRHCAMYDPDSPQVEQCFQSKMRELSPACRTSIQAVTKGRRGRP